VDLERAGDRARDVVPGDVDHACARRGQVGEGIREEVEVVRPAAGTFVDNLFEARAAVRRTVYLASCVLGMGNGVPWR